MEEIIRHCDSCTCYTEKHTNNVPIGQKMANFSDGECAYITFRLLVLEFMAKKGFSALKLSKETKVCYKTISGIVKGTGKHLSMNTIARIFNLMRDMGFMQE